MSKHLIEQEEDFITPEKWYKRHNSAYKSIWKCFERWLGEQGITWQGLLKRSPRQIRNLIDEHLTEIKPKSTTRSMVTRNGVIRSFLLVNDITLLKSRITLKGDKPSNISKLTPDSLRDLIMGMNSLRLRSFFLVKFQTIQDTKRMMWISDNAWPQIKSQLDDGGWRDRNGRLWKNVIRIDMPCGRKMNLDKPYFCFMGKDAIKALERYIEVDGMPDPNGPIWKQLTTTNTVVQSMLRQARKLGYVPKHQSRSYNLGVRYGFNPHEMRDVAKSLWHESGADLTVCDFVMGHIVDNLGYDKIYTLSPVYAVKEFKKAEPYLNLMSSGMKISSTQEEETIKKLKSLTEKYEDLVRKFESLEDLIED